MRHSGDQEVRIDRLEEPDFSVARSGPRVELYYKEEPKSIDSEHSESLRHFSII